MIGDISRENRQNKEKWPYEVLEDVYNRFVVDGKQKNTGKQKIHGDSIINAAHLFTNKPPPQKQAVILRRSIFFLLSTFVVIEIAFDTLFFLFRMIPAWLPPSPVFSAIFSSWSLVLLVIFSILKITFMLFATLSWITTRYELRGPEIRFKYGILFTEEKIYLVKYSQEVVCDQSLLGRIFNYGTIQIYNPVLKETIYIDAIPDPKRYTEMIKANLPNPKGAELVPL